MATDNLNMEGYEHTEVPTQELAFIAEKTLKTLTAPANLNSGDLHDIYIKRTDDFEEPELLEVQYSDSRGGLIRELIFVDPVYAEKRPRICVSIEGVQAMHRAIGVLSRKVDNLVHTLRSCRAAYFHELTALREQVYQVSFAAENNPNALQSKASRKTNPVVHEALYFDPTQFDTSISDEVLDRKLKDATKDIQEKLKTSREEVQRLEKRLRLYERDVGSINDPRNRIERLLETVALEKVLDMVRAAMGRASQDDYYDAIQVQLNEYKVERGLEPDKSIEEELEESKKQVKNLLSQLAEAQARAAEHQKEAGTFKQQLITTRDEAKREVNTITEKYEATVLELQELRDSIRGAETNHSEQMGIFEKKKADMQANLDQLTNELLEKEQALKRYVAAKRIAESGAGKKVENLAPEEVVALATEKMNKKEIATLVTELSDHIGDDEKVQLVSHIISTLPAEVRGKVGKKLMPSISGPAMLQEAVKDVDAATAEKLAINFKTKLESKARQEVMKAYMVGMEVEEAIHFCKSLPDHTLKAVVVESVNNLAQTIPSRESDSEDSADEGKTAKILFDPANDLNRKARRALLQRLIKRLPAYEIKQLAQSMGTKARAGLFETVFEEQDCENVKRAAGMLHQADALQAFADGLSQEAKNVIAPFILDRASQSALSDLRQNTKMDGAISAAAEKAARRVTGVATQTDIQGVGLCLLPQDQQRKMNRIAGRPTYVATKSNAKEHAADGEASPPMTQPHTPASAGKKSMRHTDGHFPKQRSSKPRSRYSSSHGSQYSSGGHDASEDSGSLPATPRHPSGLQSTKHANLAQIAEKNGGDGASPPSTGSSRRRQSKLLHLESQLANASRPRTPNSRPGTGGFIETLSTPMQDAVDMLKERHKEARGATPDDKSSRPSSAGKASTGPQKPSKASSHTSSTEHGGQAVIDAAQAAADQQRDSEHDLQHPDEVEAHEEDEDDPEDEVPASAFPPLSAQRYASHHSHKSVTSRDSSSRGSDDGWLKNMFPAFEASCQTAMHIGVADEKPRIEFHDDFTNIERDCLLEMVDMVQEFIKSLENSGVARGAVKLMRKLQESVRATQDMIKKTGEMSDGQLNQILNSSQNYRDQIVEDGLMSDSTIALAAAHTEALVRFGADSYQARQANDAYERAMAAEHMQHHAVESGMFADVEQAASAHMEAVAQHGEDSAEALAASERYVQAMQENNAGPVGSSASKAAYTQAVSDGVVANTVEAVLKFEEAVAANGGLSERALAASKEYVEKMAEAMGAPAESLLQPVKQAQDVTQARGETLPPEALAAAAFYSNAVANSNAMPESALEASAAYYEAIEAAGGIPEEAMQASDDFFGAMGEQANVPQAALNNSHVNVKRRISTIVATDVQPAENADEPDVDYRMSLESRYGPASNQMFKALQAQRIAAELQVEQAQKAEEQRRKHDQAASKKPHIEVTSASRGPYAMPMMDHPDAPSSGLGGSSAMPVKDALRDASRGPSPMPATGGSRGPSPMPRGQSPMPGAGGSIAPTSSSSSATAKGSSGRGGLQSAGGVYQVDSMRGSMHEAPPVLHQGDVQTQMSRRTNASQEVVALENLHSNMAAKYGPGSAQAAALVPAVAETMALQMGLSAQAAVSAGVEARYMVSGIDDIQSVAGASDGFAKAMSEHGPASMEAVAASETYAEAITSQSALPPAVAAAKGAQVVAMAHHGARSVQAAKASTELVHAVASNVTAFESYKARDPQMSGSLVGSDGLENAATTFITPMQVQRLSMSADPVAAAQTQEQLKQMQERQRQIEEEHQEHVKQLEEEHRKQVFEAETVQMSATATVHALEEHGISSSEAVEASVAYTEAVALQSGLAPEEAAAAAAQAREIIASTDTVEEVMHAKESFSDMLAEHGSGAEETVAAAEVYAEAMVSCGTMPEEVAAAAGTQVRTVAQHGMKSEEAATASVAYVQAVAQSAGAIKPVTPPPLPQLPQLPSLVSGEATSGSRPRSQAQMADEDMSPRHRMAVAVPAVCSCGSTFMPDASYCRKCGNKRSQATSTAVATQALPQGYATLVQPGAAHTSLHLPFVRPAPAAGHEVYQHMEAGEGDPRAAQTAGNIVSMPEAPDSSAGHRGMTGHKLNSSQMMPVYARPQGSPTPPQGANRAPSRQLVDRGAAAWAQVRAFGKVFAPKQKDLLAGIRDQLPEDHVDATTGMSALPVHSTLQRSARPQDDKSGSAGKERESIANQRLKAPGSLGRSGVSPTPAGLGVYTSGRSGQDTVTEDDFRSSKGSRRRQGSKDRRGSSPGEGLGSREPSKARASTLMDTSIFKIDQSAVDRQRHRKGSIDWGQELASLPGVAKASVEQSERRRNSQTSDETSSLSSSDEGRTGTNSMGSPSASRQGNMKRNSGLGPSRPADYGTAGSNRSALSGIGGTSLKPKAAEAFVRASMEPSDPQAKLLPVETAERLRKEVEATLHTGRMAEARHSMEGVMDKEELNQLEDSVAATAMQNFMAIANFLKASGVNLVPGKDDGNQMNDRLAEAHAHAVNSAVESAVRIYRKVSDQIEGEAPVKGQRKKAALKSKAMDEEGNLDGLVIGEGQNSTEGRRNKPRPTLHPAKKNTLDEEVAPPPPGRAANAEEWLNFFQGKSGGKNSLQSGNQVFTQPMTDAGAQRLGLRTRLKPLRTMQKNLPGMQVGTAMSTTKLGDKIPLSPGNVVAKDRPHLERLSTFGRSEIDKETGGLDGMLAIRPGLGKIQQRWQAAAALVKPPLPGQRLVQVIQSLKEARTEEQGDDPEKLQSTTPRLQPLQNPESHQVDASRWLMGPDDVAGEDGMRIHVVPQRLAKKREGTLGRKLAALPGRDMPHGEKLGEGANDAWLQVSAATSNSTPRTEAHPTPRVEAAKSVEGRSDEEDEEEEFSNEEEEELKVRGEGHRETALLARANTMKKVSLDQVPENWRSIKQLENGEEDELQALQLPTAPQSARIARGRNIYATEEEEEMQGSLTDRAIVPQLGKSSLQEKRRSSPTIGALVARVREQLEKHDRSLAACWVRIESAYGESGLTLGGLQRGMVEAGVSADDAGIFLQTMIEIQNGTASAMIAGDRAPRREDFMSALMPGKLPQKAYDSAQRRASSGAAWWSEGRISPNYHTTRVPDGLTSRDANTILTARPPNMHL